MKELLEQLTILRGAAYAIEASMPALADDCGHDDVQAAHDLLIAIERSLSAIRVELDLPSHDEMERVIGEMAHALIGTGDWTEEQLQTAWGITPKGGQGS